MIHLLLVMAGGALGAGARHGVNVAALRWFGPGFPFGTLTVNVLGGLLMGVLAGWFATRTDASLGTRLFLATGILGGFTTFSSFSLEAVLLWERGEATAAAGYVALSVIVSIAALVAGLALMRALS